MNLRNLSALALVALVCGCGTEEGGNPTPREARLFQATDGYALDCPAGKYPGNDDVTMYITYPKGGETFQVGDSILVGFCKDDVNDVTADAKLILRKSDFFGDLVDFGGGDGSPSKVDSLRLEGKFLWVVPESFAGKNAQTGESITASPSENAVKLRIEAYNMPDTDWDDSESFKIQDRS